MKKIALISCFIIKNQRYEDLVLIMQFCKDKFISMKESQSVLNLNDLNKIQQLLEDEELAEYDDLLYQDDEYLELPPLLVNNLLDQSDEDKGRFQEEKQWVYLIIDFVFDRERKNFGTYFIFMNCILLAYVLLAHILRISERNHIIFISFTVLAISSLLI